MIYLGLFLSFLILLILFLVWILLLVNFYRSWFYRLVPPVVRQYLANRLKIGYQPYQAAIRSLGSMLLEMVKIATFVFVSALLILIFIYLTKNNL
jgi:uncharacterized membrane protein